MHEPAPSSLDPEAEAFIHRLIQEGTRQRLPELFKAGSPAEALYRVPERAGVGVVAMRSTCLEEAQLLTLLKYRWGQYLHPAVGIHDPGVIAETRMEHEPLSEIEPEDVHVIAASVETGHILCYAVIRALSLSGASAPLTPQTTLRDRERPLFQVEKFHGWGIYNRLRLLPDLPITRIREVGRFVKNQGLHPFSEVSARAPVEVGLAVARLLLGPLRSEIDAFVGDLEEGVSKQNLDFLHVPTVLIRGTVPYVPEFSLAFPRYQYRTIYPVAVLTADLAQARARLEAVEAALARPGKQGLLALFSLKGDSHPVRSSLEPPEGLPALDAAPIPQRELPMAARRRMRDAGVELRRIDLFSGLSESEGAILASFMERIEVEAGAVIVRQGEQGDDMYLIEAGQAEVRLRLEDGPPLTLAVRGPDDYFGEIALLTGGERTADVVALTPMTLRRLGREAYVRYLAHMVEVERKITSVAARRARTTARRRVSADTASASQEKES